MFLSFSTALSALNATATAIDVVGTNLANLNSPGFKDSQVIFHDLMTQSLGAEFGATQLSAGTGQPLTFRQFAQGTIQSTGGLLDAAIEGNGLFVVKDSAGVTLYTRAGNFAMDKTGVLRTATGEKVQGWSTLTDTGAVDTGGATGDIVVPVGSLREPKPTKSFSVDLNLDSNAKADSSSDFSTPVTVYDSLGTAHVLTIQFEKTAANQWNYKVTIPGDDVSGGTAGTPFEIPGATGSLTFGTDGKLTSPAAGSPITFDITGLSDGAADLAGLKWNPYTDSGTAHITQFGQNSAASATSQDGAASAQLTRVAIGDGGEILAQYSSGEQVVVGKLALAAITNPDSLVGVGNNNYQVSSRTAAPTIGVAGTGGRGSIVGGSIEASTVDIAREFTNLMVYQRAYQANVRVVTTTDTLSQDTINLIR
jgi:flagellar hook protein FlgE